LIEFKNAIFSNILAGFFQQSNNWKGADNVTRRGKCLDNQWSKDWSKELDGADLKTNITVLTPDRRQTKRASLARDAVSFDSLQTLIIALIVSSFKNCGCCAPRLSNS
jgi:hypothetical protein